MSMYNVRDAFEVLQERGIARDKQEVRKWLNEGLIEAVPPINRRVGWKIDPAALQRFIEKFENGELQELIQRRRMTKSRLHDASSNAVTSSLRLQAPSGNPIPPSSYLEDEVRTLRQQVRTLRRELNDLKKVLGFPILVPSDTERQTDS